VSNNVEASLGSRKVKEMHTKRLAELKDALTKGNKVELQTKYFVLLPEQKAHENFHPIGDAALFTVFRLYPSWDWYKLPQAYLESPYLSTNQESLSNFFKHINEEVCSVDALNNDDVNPESGPCNVPNCTSDVSGVDSKDNDIISVLFTIPKHQVCIIFVCIYFIH